MRKGLLGPLAAVLAGAGAALAQTPGPPEPAAPRPLALAPESGPNPARPTPEQTATPQTPDGTCGPAVVEGPMLVVSGQWYGNADYILWWTKGHRLPPLATTGTLGVEGTQVLFGDRAVDDRARSGVRFTTGIWVDPAQTLGFEGGAVFLGQKGTHFAASSTGTTILARPFVTTDTSQAIPTATETAFLVASPSSAGAINVVTNNQLWGAEANARLNVNGDQCYRADLLAGFRYLQVKDDLHIDSASSATAGLLPLFPPGRPVTVTGFSLSDQIATRNQFYGGQLGTHLEARRSSWFADFTAKLALGVVHQVVDGGGTTLAVNPLQGLTPLPSPTVFPGGLFAQPGVNLGRHRRDEFGVVPELGVNVGYQLGDHCRAYVGYSLLYFPGDVVRPGTQIDRVFDTAAKPRSNFHFKDQDFWAQGVSAGVELSF
jgi:hypothetical protein